jgi:hypothetical protein
VADDRGIACALTNLVVVNLELDRQDEAKLFLGRAHLISSELGLSHVDSVLEAFEEVCEWAGMATAYLAQLTEDSTSGATQ